jgi:hypothetical protein
VIGTNTCVGRPSSTPSKPARATPTMVYAWLLMTIDWPTIDGSAEKRLDQKP